MKVTIVSRYPRVDTMPWKLHLAKRLLGLGADVSVLYSRARLRDQAQSGLREFGPAGLARAYLSRRARSHGSDGVAVETLATWARKHGLEVSEHSRLGDPDCLAALRRLAPDLLVLAGSDIVPMSVLATARMGTLNGHYGLLPRYRGMNVTEWSIWHDDPVGVTVHFVDHGIDTGNIVLQAPVPVSAGDTLEILRRKHQAATSRLLGDAIERIAAGNGHGVPQRTDAGRQYYRMHPLLRQRVEEKLRDGEYAWIGVEPDGDLMDLRGGGVGASAQGPPSAAPSP